MIKNIQKSEIIKLKNEVTYQDGQVVSKTLVKTAIANISIFAFDQGEGLSAHTSTGDAMVTILDGSARITIDETDYLLKENDTIVMPANIKHALVAEEKFKMLLTIIFDK